MIASPPPPIDQSLLQGLEETMGEQVMVTMMQRLHEESRRLETALVAASARLDMTRLIDVAHETRGMFANVGCVLVAALAARMENAARRDHASEVETLMPALCQAMAQASHYLVGKYPQT